MKQLLLFSIVVFTSTFNLFAKEIADEKIINKHFDVIQTFADVRSHCEQIGKEIKKWSDKTKVAEAQKIYFAVKAKADGVSSRYKSIVQNHRLARKNKEDIRVQLNELIDEHNKLVKFYEDNYKEFATGSAFSVTGFPLDTIKEIAQTIITEIRKANQARKDAMKKEVEDNNLREWDAI